MISSGTKRGLAYSAITALAVTGLPLTAGSANAEPLTGQYTAGQVELLSQFSGGASVKNDGQNTTVRLEAGAGSDVTAVKFQYNTGNPDTWVDITTVSTRNDDGAFAYEWNASGLAGATVSLRAIGVTASTTDTDDMDDVAGVTITGAGVAAESVNLNDGSSLGVYQIPGTNNGRAVVSGTTSSTDDADTVALSWIDGETVNPAGSAAVEVADGATSGTFRGVAELDGYDFAGSPDQVVIGAELDSDDVESYTLYNQVITSATAEADRTQVPSAGDTATVTVTLVDQEGAPIAGAAVRASNPSITDAAEKTTDANGQVEFKQAPGTSYYYGDADNSDTYNAGLGDKRTEDVTVTQYAPAPTSLDADSADGAAFDLDEYAAGDITVQVEDQQGNDAETSATQELRYYWVRTPFPGTDAEPTRYPAADATPSYYSETGETDGGYVVDFPAGAKPGTYELYASLTERPLVGGGNIAESKVLTVKAGNSEVTFDETSPEQAPAGGQEVVDGQLVLEDGTPLPGRTLNLDYEHDATTTNEDPTPDAGFLKADDTLETTREVKTDAAGEFSVTVKDPVEDPQRAELGGNVEVTSSIAPEANQGVDFLVDVTPAKVVIGGGDNAADRPGEYETYTVYVESGDQDPETEGVQGIPLANQTVTLTTDHGYFTDGKPVMTAGEDAGVYDNDGQSITVTTDDEGMATFNIAMGRDAGFDDDGMVTSTITATAGAASDTEDQPWTSENPLNGGEVTVEFAPAAQQESGILPEAPTHDDVDLLVKAFDQFGNRVGDEHVTLSDDRDGAGVDTSVWTDYDEESDAEAWADSAGDQKVTASWTTSTSGYVADGPDEGTEPDLVSDTETLTDDIVIEWYDVDYAASTYTMVSDADGTEPVGSTVIVTYRAVDQKGEPIDGMPVAFFRSGPDDQQDGDGNANAYTNANGVARYVFAGTEEGTATIEAIAFDGAWDDKYYFEYQGNPIPESRATTKVTFGAEEPGEIDLDPVLKGKNNGKRDDKLKVITNNTVGEGARVKLYKVRKNGKKVFLESGRLGPFGNKTFRVDDNNGRKFTKYVAKVVARKAINTKQMTNRKRVR